MPDAAEIDFFVLQLDHRSDLREPVEAFQERVFDRLADAAGKGQKLRRGQALVAEEDDEIIEPGAADCGDGGFVQLAEIDAENLRADRPGERADFEGIAEGQSPAALRNAALIRDCHPGPPARKCATISGSRRMLTASFGVAFLGRPPRRMSFPAS